MKKLISLLSLLPLCGFAQNMETPADTLAAPTKGEAVQKVVAYTSVDDWGTVVKQLDVTVSCPGILPSLKASDFDITNNVANTFYDIETGEMIKEYEDDQIELSYDGSVLHIKARPFDAEGKRNQRFQKEAWKVTSATHPELSFTGKDVDVTRIEVIDDCINGTYSFGGLTREYMLYLPKDAEGKTMKNVPLFVWQIGGGEYNQDMMTVALANKCLVSLPQHDVKAATLVFAIANPNYTYSASLYPEKLELIDRNNALQMAFIDELIANGTIDGSQLFCAGASSGGGCTMRFMMQFAHRFKAAIPCCAMDPIVPIHKVEEEYDGQWLKDVTVAFQGKVNKWNPEIVNVDGSCGNMELQPIDTKAFVNLPMYFVHAEDDQTCKVASSHVYFNARKNLGAKADKIQIYSDADMKAYGFGGFLAHFSWCRLLNDYTEGSAMDWLVGQMK